MIRGTEQGGGVKTSDCTYSETNMNVLQGDSYGKGTESHEH